MSGLGCAYEHFVTDILEHTCVGRAEAAKKACAKGYLTKGSSSTSRRAGSHGKLMGQLSDWLIKRAGCGFLTEKR